MAARAWTVYTLLLCSCAKATISGGLCTKPCNNGGHCHKFLDRCICVGHWVGQYCENATACMSSPCRNGGTCESSLATDFICRCPANVSGDHCEKNYVHPCWSSPCQNDGTCVPTPESYMCLCSLDFSGERCEYTWRDRCISRPCQNGGSCKWENGEDYVCACAKGFEGQNCEKVRNTTAHTHTHAHGDLLSTSGGVVLLVILSLGGLFVLVGVCYCCFPALRPLYVPPTTSEGEAHVSSAHSHVTSAQADLGSGSYQQSWKAASLAHGTAPLPAGVLSKSGAHAALGYDAAYVHAPASFEGAYIHAPAAFEGAYVHADKPHRYLRTAASVDEGGGRHPAKAIKRPSTPPPTYDESLVTLPSV